MSDPIDFGIRIPLTDQQCMEETWEAFAHLVVDKDGKIEKINAKAEAVFGYPKGELVNKYVEILVDPAVNDHVAFRKMFYADPSVRPINAGLQVQGIKRNMSMVNVIVTLCQIWKNEKPYTIVMVAEIAARKTPPRTGTPNA